MHELAMSQDIVRVALSAAGPGRRLCAIAVAVGVLSAVNPSALEFGLRTALEEAGHPGAEVRLRPVPALVECECGKRYGPQSMFEPCPDCGSFARKVLEGLDVVIDYVEVEDEED